MGNVFANGREISGKGTPNKSIAAFPSVCLSPPSPPAGPIPIPYPVTAMSTDTTDGTGSVLVNKKEAGHKNASVYKKCNGNQPATKSFGMDVASHTLEGKTKFASYSFDVLIEKGGAERFMDPTTSNHMNPGTAFTMSVASPAPPGVPTDEDCAVLEERNREFREKFDDTKIGKKTFGEAGTVSSGVFRSAGKKVALTGVSASSQLAGCGRNLAAPTTNVHESTTTMDRKTKKPKLKKDKTPYAKSPKSYKMSVCPGDACISPGGGIHAHAELNIINNIPQPTTKADKLLLNINWNSTYPRVRKNDPNPCSNCKTAIACACKCLTIIICNEQGKPVDRCAEPYKKEKPKRKKSSRKPSKRARKKGK